MLSSIIKKISISGAKVGQVCLQLTVKDWGSLSMGLLGCDRNPLPGQPLATPNSLPSVGIWGTRATSQKYEAHATCCAATDKLFCFCRGGFVSLAGIHKARAGSLVSWLFTALDHSEFVSMKAYFLRKQMLKFT